MTGFRLRPRRSAITAATAILFVAAACCVRADLVIVQRGEGGSQTGEMTMKIKDDKARADLSPQISTIIDAATGDVTTLMHERKTFIRITAAAAKELGARMKKAEHETDNNTPARPQLQPTGKKER